MRRTLEVESGGGRPGNEGGGRRLAALLVAALLALPAADASAANGFDANRFQAPPLPADGLTLQRPGTIEAGTFSGALTLSYANDPLVIEEALERGVIRSQTVISDQLWGYLSAGYGLTKNIAAHVILPVSIHQEGNPSGTDFSSSLHSAAVGDLGVGGRLRLFGGTPTSSFGAAVDGVLFIPTGSREAFASDGKLRFRGTLIAEAVPSSLFITANVGVLTRPEIEVVETITANMLQVNLAAGVRTSTDWLRIGLETNLQTPFGDNEGTGFETLLVGALSLWGLNASVGVGPGFGDGAGTPDYRVVARLGWSTPASDPR